MAGSMVTIEYRNILSCPYKSRVSNRICSSKCGDSRYGTFICSRAPFSSEESLVSCKDEVDIGDWCLAAFLLKNRGLMIMGLNRCFQKPRFVSQTALSLNRRFFENNA